MCDRKGCNKPSNKENWIYKGKVKIFLCNNCYKEWLILVKKNLYLHDLSQIFHDFLNRIEKKSEWRIACIPLPSLGG